MTATRIDGKAFAANLRERVGAMAAAFEAEAGRKAGLAVVLVGEDPASQVYVGSKGKATVAANMASFEHRLPDDTSEADLLALVEQLNNDPAVDGILVQLPLPDHLDEQSIISAISPDKDVDGFHVINAGRLSVGQSGFVPCTPLGCMMLLADRLGDLSGLEAVVIGRSNIVGKPMAQLLLDANATVTIAHSRTKDLPAVVRRADIVVAAVGRAEMVKAEWLKPGATVIDVASTAAARAGQGQGQAGGRRGLWRRKRSRRRDYAGTGWGRTDDHRCLAPEHAGSRHIAMRGSGYLRRYENCRRPNARTRIECMCRKQAPRSETRSYRSHPDRCSGEAQPSKVVAAEIAYGQAAKERGQYTAAREFAGPAAMYHGRNGPVSALTLLDSLGADPETSVIWGPKAVAISCDATLAVSQGRYQDAEGIVGNYVTVWQRQPDREYRWIYDVAGPDVPQPPKPKPTEVDENAIVVTAIDAVARSDRRLPEARRGYARTAPVSLGGDVPQGGGVSPDGTLRWRWEHRADGTKYVAVDYLYQGAWQTAIEEGLTSPAE